MVRATLISAAPCEPVSTFISSAQARPGAIRLKGPPAASSPDTMPPAARNVRRGIGLMVLIQDSFALKLMAIQCRIVDKAPPSTAHAAPLTKLAASDSKNVTTSPTSGGDPI